MRKVQTLLLFAGCLALGAAATDGTTATDPQVSTPAAGDEVVESLEPVEDGETPITPAKKPAASTLTTPAATTQAETTTPKATPALVVATTKAKNLPHMELLSPVKRKDVDMNRLASKPCGGTKMGPVHYETTPGSRNLVAWKIQTPAPNGRCVIRVSDSPKEKDMVVVRPTDNSAADDGSFACGREITNYEAKEIKIPRELTCDTCILQLVWLTEDGDQYRCTDFESVGSEVPECFGQCLNSGICRNGKCACQDGFSGSNCQFEDEPEEGESFMTVLFDDSIIIIVYALMLALIIGLFIAAYKHYKNAKNARVVSGADRESDKLTSNIGNDIAKSRFEKQAE